MSRIVMTLFSDSKTDDPTALVESCRLGHALCDDVLVGVNGRHETFQYLMQMSGRGLREAQITLNINAKSGRGHEATKQSARVFFNGYESPLWEQAEVGEVWRRLSQNYDEEQGNELARANWATDFTKADSYMLDRPDVAVAVMKELELVAMKMPVKSKMGFYRVIVLLRERAEEFTYKAEFKDHIGAVHIDVPTDQGMRRTALIREPFKWTHLEELPNPTLSQPGMPILATSLQRPSLPSVTRNALTMKRLLNERRVESQSELAAMIAMSPATVSKTLSVLELPKPLFDLLHRYPHRFGSRVCYAMSRHYKKHGELVVNKLEDFARRMIEMPLSQQELKAFENRTQF